MTGIDISKAKVSIIPAPQSLKLKLLLGLAVILFVLGIFLPMITLAKFIVAKNSFSVVSGVIELLREGQVILFVLITAFSIVLPIMKIGVIYQILSLDNGNKQKMNKYLHLMHEYGRWAMLDVMVVAVLITTVKLGAIASIKVHIGLFVFGAAVLLIMLITNRVVGLTQESEIELEKNDTEALKSKPEALKSKPSLD